MRRLALFTALATGTFLIGCPNPGIGPGGGAGGTTSSGGTTNSGGSTSSGGTTTTTCSGADCPGEPLLLTFGEEGVDAGKTISFTKDNRVLWTGISNPPMSNNVLFFKFITQDGFEDASYSLEGTGEQIPSGAVESDGQYILTGRGDPSGGSAVDGFVSYFDTEMHDLMPSDTGTIYSMDKDEVSAVVAGPPGNSSSVFVAGVIGGKATLPGDAGPTLGDADDLFVMGLESKANDTWVTLLRSEMGAGVRSVVGGLDRNPADSRLYLGVTVKSPLIVPTDPMETLTLATDDPSDGVVIAIDPTDASATPAKTIYHFDSNKADAITAVLVDPVGDSKYAAGQTFYVAGTLEGDALKINGTAQDSNNSAAGVDGFVVRMAQTGEVVWYQRFTGPGTQQIHALAIAGDSIFAAGTFDQTGTLGLSTISHMTMSLDMVLFRLAQEDGIVRSVGISNGSGPEWPASIGVSGSTAGGDLAVWMTGDFKEGFSFLGKTAISKGDFDGFLMRIPQ